MHKTEKILLELVNLQKRNGDRRFYFTPSGYVGIGSCVARLDRRDRRNLSSKKIARLFPFIAAHMDIHEVTGNYDINSHLAHAEEADGCSIFPFTFAERACGFHHSYIRSKSSGMLVDLADTEKIECLGLTPNDELFRVTSVNLAGSGQIGRHVGSVVVDDWRNPSFALVCLSDGGEAIKRANRAFLHTT